MWCQACLVLGKQQENKQPHASTSAESIEALDASVCSLWADPNHAHCSYDSTYMVCTAKHMHSSAR